MFIWIKGSNLFRISRYVAIVCFPSLEGPQNLQTGDSCDVPARQKVKFYKFFLFYNLISSCIKSLKHEFFPSFFC